MIACKMATSEVYQLKITLQQTRPPIWRRVLVPATIRLDDLHKVIQAAMGWCDSHQHQFNIGGIEYAGSEVLDDNEFDAVDERTVTLSETVSAVKAAFSYEYDFGDSWAHRIVLEKILPAEPEQRLPCCVTGKRACPQEDCGGVWGYSELLETIKDPDHPEHEDMLEWLGEDFDPEHFDAEEVNQRLSQRSWSRR